MIYQERKVTYELANRICVPHDRSSRHSTIAWLVIRYRLLLVNTMRNTDVFWLALPMVCGQRRRQATCQGRGFVQNPLVTQLIGFTYHINTTCSATRRGESHGAEKIATKHVCTKSSCKCQGFIRSQHITSDTDSFWSGIPMCLGSDTD